MKKCPFCGCNGELKTQIISTGHHDYEQIAYVTCKNCGATGETFSEVEQSIEESKQLAMQAWNNRKRSKKDGTPKSVTVPNVPLWQ